MTLLLTMLGLMTCGCARVSSAETEKVASKNVYRVFCVNGKIEVGSRTVEQMKAVRGPNVWQVKEAEHLLEAQQSASHLGGIGQVCQVSAEGVFR
jgi:hypothetical protein